MDTSTTTAAAAARHSALPFGPIASFTIAMVTLSVTSFLKAVNIINKSDPMTINNILYHQHQHHDNTLLSSSSSSSPQLSNVNVYNVHDVDLTHPHAALRLSAHTKTNRTLWQVVNSSQFHAGIQRVEPLAWIPSQSYDTEALLIVVSSVDSNGAKTSGSGAVVYDEHGFSVCVEQGAMIHVKKNSLHAVQNPDPEHALLLVWTFPTRFGVTKTQFRDNYDFGVVDRGEENNDKDHDNDNGDASNNVKVNANANVSGDGVGTDDGERSGSGKE